MPGIVARMRRQCSRPACAEPAVATVTYHYGEQAAWLDPLDRRARPARATTCAPATPSACARRRAGCSTIAACGRPASVARRRLSGGRRGRRDRDRPRHPRCGSHLARRVRRVERRGVRRSLLSAGYGGADDPDPPLWLTAVLQVPFWVVLVGGAVFFSRRKGTGDLRVDMGLRAEPRDAVRGLPIGAVDPARPGARSSTVPIFWIFDLDPDELSDAARELTDRATGAGVVVLRAARRHRGADRRGAVLPRLPDGSARPGVRHRLGAVAQRAVLRRDPLPAAAAPGAGAVRARRSALLVHRYGRLGPAIFAHMAFNAVTITILLLQE